MDAAADEDHPSKISNPGEAPPMQKSEAVSSDAGGFEVDQLTALLKLITPAPSNM